jgi:hypothetical protein
MSEEVLLIPFIRGSKENISIGEVSDILDHQQKNRIDIAPWPGFIGKPKVLFSIAHNGGHLFIKYDVTETEVLARYKHINDPVYKDSCVEFFINFDNEKSYYNIEFNRLGTCLGGYGTERENRTELPVPLLKTIKHERTLKQIKDFGEPVINWTLTVSVPIQVFCFHKFKTIRHQESKMNFFKCGDDLSHPHYLVWGNIDWPEPNFHLPEFFGKVEFL